MGLLTVKKFQANYWILSLEAPSKLLAGIGCYASKHVGTYIHEHEQARSGFGVSSSLCLQMGTYIHEHEKARGGFGVSSSLCLQSCQGYRGMQTCSGFSVLGI